MNTKEYPGRFSGFLFAVAVFATALLVRGYHLTDIQPHHDEAPLFGLNQTKPLEWAGSIERFLTALTSNAAYITDSDAPPSACLVAELFRFVFGENLAAARRFHAILQSLGVALVAWLAWRIYCPLWAPAVAVAVLASFSVVSIAVGQFGEMYAIYFLAAVVQYLVYWLILKDKYTWSRYGAFAVVAVFCAYFEYLQAWVTLGLLLASVLHKSRVGRIHRLIRSLFALLIYGLLNILPMIVFISGAGARERGGLSAGYRPYYFRYYPPYYLHTRGLEAALTLVRYYAVQTYDLFNYYLSLVFRPEMYQPREWNWLSIPFIIIALMAGVRSIQRRRPAPNGVFTVLASMLGLYILGNMFLLLPYGGVRNSIFIAPIIWLAYGDIVARLQYGTAVRRRTRALIMTGLIILPLLPFALSLPGFYRDRISRFDLTTLGRLLEEHRPDTLIMPEPTYVVYRLLLQRHPYFKSKYIEPNKVTVTSFFEFYQPWPRKVSGRKVLAVDCFLSADSRYEGFGIKKHHISLNRLTETKSKFEPLVEVLGNSLHTREHMSIYFPPNSFFIYLLRQEAEF